MKKMFEDIALPGVCEVCGRVVPVAVVASTFGSFSFSCCHECLKDGLEPYSSIVDVVWCVRWDNMADWAKERIEYMLSKLGKTKEEMFQKVSEFDEQYKREMLNVLEEDV